MDFVALVAIHTFGAATTSLAAWWALRRKRLYAFLFGGLLAYQLLTMLRLVPLVDEFGLDVVSIAAALSITGCVSLWLAIWIFERVTQSVATRTDRNPILEGAALWHHYLPLALICLLAIAAVAARRGELILEMNWEEFRSQVTFLDSLATLLQFLVFPAAWVALRAGRKSWAVMFGLVTLITFPVFGSRAALLALPAAIALDLLRSGFGRARAIRLLWALGLAAVGLHVLGRIVRGLGIGGIYRIASGQTDARDVADEVFENVDFTGGETEISRYFMFALGQAPFPDIDPLVSVRRWLLFYAPQSVFPDLKPEDGIYALWRHAANAGIFDDYPFIERIIELLRFGDSGSIQATLWGELWLNGGWAAIPIAVVVLGFIVVAIERGIERLPSLCAALVAPATAVGYLMVARGNSVIGLGYFFYLFPIGLAISTGYGAIRAILVRSQLRPPTISDCGR
jgi:hypothetical protein